MPIIFPSGYLNGLAFCSANKGYNALISAKTTSDHCGLLLPVNKKTGHHTLPITLSEVDDFQNLVNFVEVMSENQVSHFFDSWGTATTHTHTNEYLLKRNLPDREENQSRWSPPTVKTAQKQRPNKVQYAIKKCPTGLFCHTLGRFPTGFLKKIWGFWSKTNDALSDAQPTMSVQWRQTDVLRQQNSATRFKSEIPQLVFMQWSRL